MTDAKIPPGARRPGLLEQDNYEVAHRAAAARLAARDPALLAARAGLRRAGPDDLALTLLGEDVQVALPSGTVSRGGAPLPLWEQILVLHYVLGVAEHPLDGPGDGWLAYRELPEASFYAAAFTRQVCQPLAARFGDDPAALAALAGRWGAVAGDTGDASLVFDVLPHVRLALVLWAGDADFPAEGNVLFSPSTASCLSAEDAAVLADVVLRLVL